MPSMPWTESKRFINQLIQELSGVSQLHQHCDVASHNACQSEMAMLTFDWLQM